MCHKVEKQAYGMCKHFRLTCRHLFVWSEQFFDMVSLIFRIASTTITLFFHCSRHTRFVSMLSVRCLSLCVCVRLNKCLCARATQFLLSARNGASKSSKQQLHQRFFSLSLLFQSTQLIWIITVIFARSLSLISIWEKCGSAKQNHTARVRVNVNASEQASEWVSVELNNNKA